MSTFISNLNARIWRRKYVVRDYTSRTALFKGEEAILCAIADTFSGKAILDIGIGTGRTTPHLLKISKDYIGIDYTQEMVQIARRVFPDVKLLQMDARDLSSFPARHFDLIFFSFNGIDCAPHYDRVKMLREIRRVLNDDGVFVFSSHNRDSKIPSAFDLRHLTSRVSKNPIKITKALAVYIVGILNSMRLKPMQVHSKEFAILNDPSYAYGALWYYISHREQITQLNNIGFKDVVAFGLEGELLDHEQPYSGSWIYYIARKGEQFSQAPDS